MMRVNQFNTSAFTQNSQNRTSRSNSSQPSFAGVMSSISGQQQPSEMISQQSGSMQMPGMSGMSGVSGMQSNFPGMMPGNMPQMPSGQMPSGEMPSGQIPEMPSGEMPSGQMPEMPSGEMPSGEMPEMPSGQMPSGFGGMSGMSRPSGFGGPQGMQMPGGSFSNPFGGNNMGSFRAMNFMNR